MPGSAAPRRLWRGLFLIGRGLFRRLSVGAAPTAHLVAAAMALVLLCTSPGFLPALAALGLLTAYLVTLLSYERLNTGRQRPTASAEAQT